MNTKKILLISSDRAVADAVPEAAARAHCSLQLAKTSADAFRALTGQVEDFAAVIIDLDPVIHGLALLEALSMCEKIPPVFALSDLEECYMKTIVREHGGIDCIGKPVDAARLVGVIAKVCPVCRTVACSCDRWGHPFSASEGFEHNALTKEFQVH